MPINELYLYAGLAVVIGLLIVYSISLAVRLRTAHRQHNLLKNTIKEDTLS